MTNARTPLSRALRLAAALAPLALLAPAAPAEEGDDHHHAESASGPGARARGAVVVGQYVEARTCDVWTGPCFANGEINLRGDQAILGWSVERGLWNGVALDGRKLVAVVDAEGTLTTEVEGRVDTAVFIEEEATEAEEKALLSMARELAPRYFERVVKVERRKIKMSVSHGEASLSVEAREGTLEHFQASTAAEPASPGGVLAASRPAPLFEVVIQTARLSTHCDAVCGNESGFYPALSRLDVKECAKAVENSYTGPLLHGRWSDPNKRSAIVGAFSL